MKIKRFMCLILPLITLVLEILPLGAVCNFANPSGEPLRKTYSYFDLTPFGYANFSPLLCAIVTCIITILLTIYCITRKERLAITAKNILYPCVILSLGPLVLGINYYSIVGGLITATLIGELIFLSIILNKRQQE